MSTLAQKNGMWSASFKVGAGGMVGTVAIRVASFLLLAVCGVLCQEREERRACNLLPDAPSTSAQAERLRTASDEASLPVAPGTVDADGARMRESEPESGSLAARADLRAVYKDQPVQKEPGDFFGKYLYPSLLKRNLSYHPSTSSSFMGRAAYAASRIFITRDDSGRGRLNTSYFLAVLSSAVVHTAYRPYWNRQVSTPFSDFGSTMGNDAGMNVLHEFAPGIQQLMKNHAPRFVSRIEERVSRKP